MVSRSQIEMYCSEHSVPLNIKNIALNAYDYVGPGNTAYGFVYTGRGATYFGLLHTSDLQRCFSSLITAWNLGLDMSHALICYDQSTGGLYWVIPEWYAVWGAWRNVWVITVGNPFVGQWWGGSTLMMMDGEVPAFRAGYSPNWVAAAPLCDNHGYHDIYIPPTPIRTQYQSYDMVGSLLGGGSKTYQAGGSVGFDTAKTYRSDGIVKATFTTQYETDAFVKGTATKSYSIMARAEAKPTVPYGIDGITELGKDITYDADAYAEKMLRTTYVAGGYTQDLATSSYAMSGLILADEFTPFEIPQAFNIRKPSTSECGGYPFDSRNM